SRDHCWFVPMAIGCFCREVKTFVQARGVNARNGRKARKSRRLSAVEAEHRRRKRDCCREADGAEIARFAARKSSAEGVISGEFSVISVTEHRVRNVERCDTRPPWVQYVAL